MPLDLHRLTHELQNSSVGHTIDYHHSIPSTMPIAHELVMQPQVRSGTIVVAEEQTAGRGRLQRQWEAPIGEALLVSIILRPPFLVAPTQLPMLAGVAAVDALAASAPTLTRQVGLKWPNDVLLGHNLEDASKVAGILLESTFQQADVYYVILGIGINVNQTATSLPFGQLGAPRPTSLRLYTGQLFDRTELLIALCRSLSEQLTGYQPVHGHQLAAQVAPQHAPQPNAELTAAWRSRLWTLGHWVSVRENLAGDPIFGGWAVDVTADGCLVIEDENRVRLAFAAGDVSIRTGSPSPF